MWLFQLWRRWHRRRSIACHRWNAAHGNAILEFLLVPVILIPLVFCFVQILVKVRLEAALDEAAQTASRAYAVSNQGAAAITAAKLALADRSVIGTARVNGSPAVITISAYVRPLGLMMLKSSRSQVLR